MTINLKYVLYAVLAAISLYCGVRFYILYSKDRPGKEQQIVQSAEKSSGKEAVMPAVSTNDLGTNAAVALTNSGVVVTNLAAATNVVTDPTNLLVSATNDNSAAASSNTTGVASAPARDSDSADITLKRGSGDSGKMFAYLAGFLLTLIALGGLVGHEVSQVLGDKTIEFLFNDEGDGIKNPEYEEAEKMWLGGKPLEAIQMMRDYLKRNPREIYVAIRIAEIYEKDLQNYLAAALEYEEILKQKLPPDRWGWSAIHLCNVYSKMGQNEKSLLLLKRIVAEYGRTPAAKKARKRLAILDGKTPEEAAALAEAAQAAELAEAEAAEQESEPEEEETPKPEKKPASNLPPGFRPKK